MLIPAELQEKMLTILHCAHMRNQSMMRRARQTIYWPGMACMVKQTADNCATRLAIKPREPNENLQLHNTCESALQKVAVDMSDFKRWRDLITVDYFSGFIEADRLEMATSASLITCLKAH